MAVAGRWVAARRFPVQVGSFERVLLPAYGSGELRRGQHTRPPHRRGAHLPLLLRRLDGVRVRGGTADGREGEEEVGEAQRGGGEMARGEERAGVALERVGAGR